MKLIIQIPCFNEAEQLPATLADLPRQIEGVDTVEWLIIDDGSSDATVEVAREQGVHHVVRLTNNKGLAAAFQAGLDACLKLGADIVVNTDADNQYKGADIPKLVAPILAGRPTWWWATARPTRSSTSHRSRSGSSGWAAPWCRRASGTGVPDATSGFRAYNREAALQIQVVSKFTYTLETLIQAGKMLVAVEHTPIRTNPQTRRVAAVPVDVGLRAAQRRCRSSAIYSLYEPMRVFFIAAAAVAVPATLIWARFLYFFFSGEGEGHVQSLILGSTLLMVAVQLVALGVIGDIMAGSRVIQQRALERVRRVELHARRGAVALRARCRGRGAHDHGRGGGAGHGQGRGARAGRGRGVTSQVEAVPTGNTFDKYGSTNPVVRRLMDGFHRSLDDLWELAGPRSVLDVGCGEGVLTHEWAERLGDGRIVGIDLDDPKLRGRVGRPAGARTSSTAPRRPRGCPSPTTSSTWRRPSRCWSTCPSRRPPWPRWRGWPSGGCWSSVPREPLWRGLNMARGAYWGALGNTPGHLNHWSQADVRRTLLARHGTVRRRARRFRGRCCSCASSS